MTTPALHTFFDGPAAQAYDARNRGLAPISENLHFLSGLALADLPDDARILCVGVGTGAEILSLARARPGWTFVGVDPSADMLDVGRARLAEAGVLDRCALICGYVDDAPAAPAFDAVLAILVAHFVQRPERPAFYAAAHQRLKPGGRLLTAEISADLDAPAFPAMLEDWKQVQARMGATPQSLDGLEGALRNVLGVLSPADTEALWRAAGFPLPVRFFQAFMIVGWHGVKG